MNPPGKTDLDLLRRVLIPKEVITENGTTVFRTSDKAVYCRLADGSIRRALPKVNGKHARKLRARARSSRGKV